MEAKQRYKYSPSHSDTGPMPGPPTANFKSPPPPPPPPPSSPGFKSQRSDFDIWQESKEEEEGGSKKKKGARNEERGKKKEKEKKKKKKKKKKDKERGKGVVIRGNDGIRKSMHFCL